MIGRATLPLFSSAATPGVSGRDHSHHHQQQQLPRTNDGTSPVLAVCRGTRGQVLELNRSTRTLHIHQLSASSTATDTVSPIVHPLAYSLKGWPTGSDPVLMQCNTLGTLLAIVGTAGNVLVVRLVGRLDSEAAVRHIEEIDVILDDDAPPPVSWIGWHPLSPAEQHLVVLSRTGTVALYDLETAVRLEDEDVAQLAVAEQVIRLAGSRRDEWTAMAFVACHGIAFPHAASSHAAYPRDPRDPWLPFAAFVLRESGDVELLCPLVPRVFRAQRQGALLPLRVSIQRALMKAEQDEATTARLKTQLRWIDGVLATCQFVSAGSGDTDWVLCEEPTVGMVGTVPSTTSFAHLQPRTQGPFLIHPEPLDVHHLAVYDRATDLAAVHLERDQPVVLAIAFASGKIDFVALVASIEGDWQLSPRGRSGLVADGISSPSPSCLSSLSSSSRPPLVLALLESVDLLTTAVSAGRKRPLSTAPVRILAYDRNIDAFLLAAETTITAVWFSGLDRVGGDDETAVFECHAMTVAERLVAPAQCIQLAATSRVYPGATTVNLDLGPVRRTAAGGSVNQTAHVSKTMTPLLEAVSRHAFPLSRMEIESGAVQLEGLVEEMGRSLARLKKAAQPATESLTLAKQTLPDGIDEVGAGRLNDHVASWQAGLVAPCLRVGHEVALRGEELVALLRTEREVLVRAQTLLATKPATLHALSRQIAAAKTKTAVLQQRLEQTGRRLCEAAQTLGTGPESPLHAELERMRDALQQISQRLAAHQPRRTDGASSSNTDQQDRLVRSQLALQASLLTRIQTALVPRHAA